MITRYQLMNTLIREYRNKNDNPNEVWTEYYNEKYLEGLIDTFKHIEILDKEYCCHGPFINCWQDIEGEGYGWIWIEHPEEEWHDLLVSWIKGRFKEFSRVLKGKKVIHIWNETYQIRRVVLPMRDTEYKRDVIISFSDNELHF